MSYENPRIVVDKSGMILAEGIANLGKYTAQGITNYYANRERIQKENEKKDSAIAAVTVDEYEKTQKQLTNFEQGYSGLAGYNKVKDLYENSLRNGEKATIRLKTTTDLNEINELKKIINSENKFRNNATGVLKKLAADASTVNDPLGVGKEFGFAGNGEEEKLITQYSLNTILGGPGSFEANRNGDLLNINFSGNINGKSYAKEINGENYVNSPFGMTYKVANLSQEGADAVNASLLKKNGEINPTNIIGTKIIDAPLEVINRSGGKIKEVGATMPIEIINVDDILIARQAEIKAQSFYSSLSPSQQEDVFNKSFNFASPTITPNGFSSFEDFTNKTKNMAPTERVNIIKAALEQTILDDTLRGAGIGTYIDAETQQNVYYRQSGPIKPKSIDKPDDTKKLTAAERKAKLAEDRAVSLVKKLDEEGVQTFIKSISAGTQFKKLGDVVTLLNVDTDGKITPGTSYNLGTKSGKESFLNDFAKAKYGSGADFDLIQDYIGKKIETAAKEVEYASVNAGPIDYSQFLIKE